MRIHLVANVFRKDALEAAVKATRWITERGVDVAVEPETGRHVKLPIVSEDEFSNAEFVIAFGGDGTLIRAAHLCSARGTPILGVYYGRFGFVTQCTGEALEQCLASLIAGDSEIESRLMLEAGLFRAGQEIATLHALNEVVLQRSINTRMMTFRVAVDGHELTSYPADGVMVSTPTGSTGYNLSAGGPIVDPNVNAMVLSAIAPHTLSARSMVLRPDSEVHLNVQSRGGESVLSSDGQTRLHILPGDDVRVKKSLRVTNLITVNRDDFLIKLGQRLLWSQGLLGGMD